MTGAHASSKAAADSLSPAGRRLPKSVSCIRPRRLRPFLPPLTQKILCPAELPQGFHHGVVFRLSKFTVSVHALP